MATKYVQKFDTEAEFIANAPDTGQHQGLASVSGVLVSNEGGVMRPVGNPAIVSLTQAVTLSKLLHAGRTCVINLAAGFAITLPAATGSGDRYRLVFGTALTTTSTVVITAGAATILKGLALINNTGDSSAATVDAYPAGASDEKFTFDHALGAGEVGDWVEFEDIASGVFAVRAHIGAEPDPATPFASA